jgi:hypothetical protein
MLSSLVINCLIPGSLPSLIRLSINSRSFFSNMMVVLFASLDVIGDIGFLFGCILFIVSDISICFAVLVCIICRNYFCRNCFDAVVVSLYGKLVCVLVSFLFLMCWCVSVLVFGVCFVVLWGCFVVVMLLIICVFLFFNWVVVV